jgi:hypothetical protein
MEGFEEFYAENVAMQENAEAPCVGKNANRERELAFLGAIEQWHGGRLLSSSVGGDVSFSEWELDITLKGAPRLAMTQVSVRRWKDGKIVAERFYHK